MSITKEENSRLNFHKIHFTIQKKVKFGQAVFVCGNTTQLGLWRPEKAYRLRWTEGDLWTSSFLLTHNIPDNIEFKYVIANWEKPSNDNSQWQLGSHNRKIDIDRSGSATICDDKWNMDRVSLYLLTCKSKKAQEEKYYVAGDIGELGNWNQKKIMKKVIKKNTLLKLKRDYQISRSSHSQELEIYSYSFYIFRGRQQFYYYYIKKAEVFQSQRKPGRVLKMNSQESYHPHRKQVCHTRGEIVVFDQCNINQLVFSKITSQIFVGSFLKSAQDVIRLKEQGVTSILSIQSERDFKKHGLTPHYLSLLCCEQGIICKKYAIEDMNNQDFVNKAEGAVKMMNELLKDGGKVYVHCSAGIYRSPQIIALYLSMFQNYSIEEAVSMIKLKHPFAKPNIKIIRETMGIMSIRQFKRRVYS